MNENLKTELTEQTPYEENQQKIRTLQSMIARIAQHQNEKRACPFVLLDQTEFDESDIESDSYFMVNFQNGKPIKKTLSNIRSKVDKRYGTARANFERTHSDLQESFKEIDALFQAAKFAELQKASAHRERLLSDYSNYFYNCQSISENNFRAKAEIIEAKKMFLSELENVKKIVSAELAESEKELSEYKATRKRELKEFENRYNATMKQSKNVLPPLTANV